MKSIAVNHRELGKVRIKLDPEDVELLSKVTVFLKREKGRNVPTYLMVALKNGKFMNASRYILKQHKLLKRGRKRVMFNDKNSFNLSKANLVQL